MSTNPDIRDYVISAAIFLGHAELENYVSDAFSIYAKCAQHTITKGGLLPARLQAHLFAHAGDLKSTFARVIAGGSEWEVLDSLSSRLRGVPGAFVDNARDFSPFGGKDVHTTAAYPSEDNLKKIFKRIGVDNVFGELGKILKQDAAALLASIGSLRTQLAHTGSIPGISVKDVNDRLSDAERFIAALDRIFYRAVCDSFSQAAWKAAA